MHTDLPKTINEALKILAYNEYFWEDTLKTKEKVSKDSSNELCPKNKE